MILSLCLSARHTTRTRRDPQRAPRPRHAHRPLAARAGQHARSRAKRNIFFRVVVVVVSSAVRLGSSGTTPNAPPSRKPGTGFRALVKYDLKRTRCPLFRTCLVAFVRDDGAERRPGTCEHFRCWVVHELPWARLLIRVPALASLSHTACTYAEDGRQAVSFWSFLEIGCVWLSLAR